MKLIYKQIYIVDKKKEFVENFIWPGVQGGVRYEGRYLLGTALARPCIAQALIEVAEKENAKFISHGATGKVSGWNKAALIIKEVNLKVYLKNLSRWKVYF